MPRRDQTFPFDIQTINDVPALSEEDLAQLERDLITLYSWEQAGHTYRAKVRLTATRTKVPPTAAYMHVNAAYLLSRALATIRALERRVGEPVPGEEAVEEAVEE